MRSLHTAGALTGVVLLAFVTACTSGSPAPDASPTRSSQEDTVTIDQTQIKANEIADAVQALIPGDQVTSVEVVDDSAGSLLGGDVDADSSVVEWHVQRTISLREPANQLQLADHAVDELDSSGWKVVYDGETTGAGGRWVELTRDADEGYQIRLQAGDDGSTPAVLSLAVTGPTVETDGDAAT